ncbi:MAG: helix-turn-helix domain-containing protein [Actinomycetota bacterium]|nr:helix-turn-helix domain-containing protein [Actinomycetota bacterium]MDP9454646.1 helix-turn-helix domain-containing protein [Actinomycetota bacterium]
MRRMDSNQTTYVRRYTVNQAAEILGISAEAVRARMNRGTLPKEKDEDGTVYVRLDGARTHTNGDHTADHTAPDSLAFQLMQDQIAFLRAELERKDHLLARALERIPAIEPPSDERGPSVRVADDVAEDQPRGEAERRSWWRRFFDL